MVKRNPEVTTLLLLLSAAWAFGAEPPIGEWEVTTLDGSISHTTTGPDDGLCEIGTETFSARKGDSFVRLAVLEPEEEIDGQAADTVQRIVDDFTGTFDLDSANPPRVDTKRLFVFHFEFDNGMDPDDYEYELNYHSNEVLYSDFGDSQVAARRDPSQQSMTLGTLPLGDALASLNAAFGGIEGYIGTWRSEGGGPVLPGRPDQLLAMEALQSGSGETGMSLFMVTGQFDGARNMGGSWSFVSVSELFECKTEATGQGSWAAAPD